MCMHHCRRRNLVVCSNIWKFSGHDLDSFRQKRVDFGGVNLKWVLDSFAFFTVLVFPWFG